MSPDRHDRRPPRGTPSQIDALVGERIRLRRAQIGLTVAELAALLGVDESDLEAIESGKKRAGPTLIAAAAAALGMPVYRFFVDTSPP
jgi:transcriptional regulator with XRE-family HTH domain